MCDPPTSANNIIMVTWSYIHTGGLSLTNVSVTFFSDGPETATNSIPVSGTDTLSIEVPDLVTGSEYTFNITAVNSIGPSSILCGPVLHRTGES